MPTTICTSNGILPITHKPCTNYTSDCACKATGACSSKKIRFTNDEVASYEHIGMPPSLAKIEHSLSNPQVNLYELFSEKSFEAVRHALTLIDRVTPLYSRSPDQDASARSYLEDTNALEIDALMLTSLLTTINTMAAYADSQARQAEADRKVVVAQKIGKIREAFTNHVRVGTVTEKGIEALTAADQEVRNARQIALDADRQARILRAMTDSIPEHVNMLKRRIDGLRQERKYTPS